MIYVVMSGLCFLGLIGLLAVMIALANTGSVADRHIQIYRKE